MALVESWVVSLSMIADNGLGGGGASAQTNDSSRVWSRNAGCSAATGKFK